MVLQLSATLFGSAALCQAPLDSKADSHIDANIPAQTDFDRILRRDLQAYFKSKTSKEVRVEYELLREGPTQTGISYPKYYLWAKALDGSKVILEGAARLSAIEKTRFEVKHFLSRQEIVASPDSVGAIFPATIVDKIRRIAC